MNKTFSTSTRIAPIVNVSTYEGPFSYESLWSSDEEYEREEGRFVCNDYDSAKMEDRIVEEANRVFEAEKPLSKYGVVSIKATKFGSPREYNFMTDWLDLEVEVNAQFLTLARQAVLKKANRKAIVKYAGDHWVSYDGFLSTMLNRISTLSRDTWKHKKYGTHMAEDDEVEKALVADLCEVFDHLENDTGDDEFREFGAVLALLWLIEYPYDFDSSGNSIYGSWVTELMVEHIRDTSSLSEFCTILEYGELDKNVKDALIDFDGFMEEAMNSYKKYVESGVGKASQERATEWLEAVRKDVEKNKEAQRNYIEMSAPNWDRVKDELNELREDWETKVLVGWSGAWK